MKNRERQRANRRLKHHMENIQRHLPKCDSTSCAGNLSGHCRILKSANWGDKACPFFKTVSQNEAEKSAAMERLVSMGRTDLIDKYSLDKVVDDYGD